MVAVTGMDKRGKRLPHRLQLCDFLVDLADMLFGQTPNVGAGATLVRIKRQKPTALLDRKAEGAGALQEAQIVERGLRVVAVIVAAAVGADELISS